MQTGAVYGIHSQGALQVTENSLDVAIRGEGFFQVNLPSGDAAYTRDGTFSSMKMAGLLPCKATIGPGITVPADEASIDGNDQGEVLVILPVNYPDNTGQSLADWQQPESHRPIVFKTDASG